MKTSKNLMIGGGVLVAIAVGLNIIQIIGGIQSSFPGLFFIPGVILLIIGAIKFLRGRKSDGKFERAAEESRRREG